MGQATKRIVLSTHAEEQIRLRNLDQALVIAVAAQPQQIVPTKGKGMVAQSKYKVGRREFLLRVVFQDLDATRLVVTVYRTTKVAKYWRQEYAK